MEKIVKKKALLICAIAGMAAVLSGCKDNLKVQGETLQSLQEETEIDKNLIVVGFSQVGAESDWRIAHTNSIKEAISEENGFYLIFDNAQQKQENQLKAVRKFILQEVDYIVLDPIVVSGWETVLQEAKDAGIPVILDDRTIAVDDESLYTCWIGSDFYKEGQDAGIWLEDYLEKQGRDKEEINIVTLFGTEGASAQIGRTDGFESILKQHENWNMLERSCGDFTQAKGREAMAALLQKYEDIDVLISENDNMTFGAVDAIREAGRSFGPNGDMIIVSFDAVRSVFDSMMNGEVNADFECNPLHGPKLLENLCALDEGKNVDKIQYMDEEYFDTSMNLEEIKSGRAY